MFSQSLNYRIASLKYIFINLSSDINVRINQQFCKQNKKKLKITYPDCFFI